MTWQNSICMSVGRTNCPAVDTLAVEVEKSNKSAIDLFYEATSVLLKLPESFFTTNEADIAGLLFVGLISSTENYFRDILGGILTICPLSQAHSADMKVQLGSLLWGPTDLHNRAAFEYTAFSNGENIRRALQQFLQHSLKPKGVCDLMLLEYDTLCEFRHAIVHSGHIVAGKNALKLGLKRTKKPLRVSIEYSSLQAAGMVCTSLVQAANNELFELLIHRWAVNWRQLPSWSSDEEKSFKRIVDTFLSERDKANNQIVNSRTRPKLMAQVKSAYSLP